MTVKMTKGLMLITAGNLKIKTAAEHSDSDIYTKPLSNILK